MTDPAAQADTPAWPDLPAVRYASVNGARLACVDQGAGASIVAVHGALSDLRIWQALGARLAADTPICAHNWRVNSTVEVLPLVPVTATAVSGCSP